MPKSPSVSIITVTYNSEATIADTIKSVINQDYDNYEYVVVDGNSSDNTVEIINSFRNRIDKIIIEEDRGIYDAINKGILASCGRYIGILNSDDVLSSKNTLKTIFQNNPDSDLLLSSIGIYTYDMKKLIRRISPFKNPKEYLKFGHFPPHPGTLIKKDCYEKNGLYSLDYKIAADFELVAKNLLDNSLSYTILQDEMTKMRIGGVSTKGLSSYLLITKELNDICKKLKIKTNIFMLNLRPFLKLKEFFR